MAVSQKILWATLAVGLCVLPMKASAKPWHDGGRVHIVPAHNFRGANRWRGHFKHRGFHQEPFQRPASPGAPAFAPPTVQPVPAWGHDHWRDRGEWRDADDRPPAWYGPRGEGDRDDYGDDDDDGGPQNYYGPGYNGSPAPCGMIPSGNWQQRRSRLLSMRRADWANYNAARRRGNGTGQQYWMNHINYLNRRLASLRTHRSMSPLGGYNCYGNGYYGGYTPASGNPFFAGAMAPFIQQFIP